MGKANYYLVSAAFLCAASQPFYIRLLGAAEVEQTHQPFAISSLWAWLILGVFWYFPCLPWTCLYFYCSSWDHPVWAPFWYGEGENKEKKWARWRKRAVLPSALLFFLMGRWQTKTNPLIFHPSLRPPQEKGAWNTIDLTSSPEAIYTGMANDLALHQS